MRWKPALNAFAVTFGDRFPAAETYKPTPPETPLVGSTPTRLRAIQHAYQAVAGHDTTLTPPEPARTVRPPGHAADKEIELE